MTPISRYSAFQRSIFNRPTLCLDFLTSRLPRPLPTDLENVDIRLSIIDTEPGKPSYSWFKVDAAIQMEIARFVE